MKPFTQKVVEIVAAVPEGYVMTYGGVAAAAGSPRGARQVVRILHAMSGKYRLPWHRIVNAQGQIVLADEESRLQQQMLLESEGIEVDAKGKVNLERWLYRPESMEEWTSLAELEAEWDRESRRGQTQGAKQ